MFSQWMIYGASGYTGTLLAEAAVAQGHKPVLAGRTPEKLRPLAERLGLDWVAFALDDTEALHRAVREVSLVLHAAGPYVETAQPMLEACVAGITNYVDITGEVAVFEQTFGYDQRAYDREIAFLTGCGFDVVPTDCLATYVAAQVEQPTDLKLVLDAGTSMSPGTAKTTLNFLAEGGLARRAGQLVAQPLGAQVARFPLPHGERLAGSITWGDLATAYRSTGIPNITVYLALHPLLVRLMRVGAPLLRLLLQSAAIQRGMKGLLGRVFNGPSAAARQTERSYLYARAANTRGQTAEAWLTTVEAYQFTALAALRCVERVLAERPRGVLTPAQAFGADFVLEIDGTTRHDALG